MNLFLNTFTFFFLVKKNNNKGKYKWHCQTRPKFWASSLAYTTLTWVILYSTVFYFLFLFFKSWWGMVFHNIWCIKTIIYLLILGKKYIYKKSFEVSVICNITLKCSKSAKVAPKLLRCIKYAAYFFIFP